jgi:hypothetical protein
LSFTRALGHAGVGSGQPNEQKATIQAGYHQGSRLLSIQLFFPKATVEEILGKLSYSSTFLEAATQSAAEKSIKHAYWALAQYDFVYKPRPGRKVDERAPFFLGVFDWNDAEDDELLAAWAAERNEPCHNLKLE